MALLGRYLKRQPFPRAWRVSLCSELNLTGTAQQSLEYPRPRGKRNCIFLLGHLKCVWPFQRLGEQQGRKKLPISGSLGQQHLPRPQRLALVQPGLTHRLLGGQSPVLITR